MAMTMKMIWDAGQAYPGQITLTAIHNRIPTDLANKSRPNKYCAYSLYMGVYSSVMQGHTHSHSAHCFILLKYTANKTLQYISSFGYDISEVGSILVYEGAVSGVI